MIDKARSKSGKRGRQASPWSKGPMCRTNNAKESWAKLRSEPKAWRGAEQ